MNKKELAPIIIGKLLNIGGMLEKKGNQLLLPFDLNQQQFSILFSIEQEGKVNQKEMINKLVLEKAHVSKVVKKLCKMGLINIETSTEDRRSSWLSITEKGGNIVRECQKHIYQWNEDWINEIDKEQLNGLLDSLTVLQDIFKSKSQSGKVE
jgi:DNA-binding MarR family transcriptional regulator